MIIEAVVGLTFLGALHTAVIGAGYVTLEVERDAPPLWLVVLNFGASIVPVCDYLLEVQRGGIKRKDE
jgi:hypothetical protein